MITVDQGRKQNQEESKAEETPDHLVKNVEAILAMDSRDAHKTRPLHKMLDSLGHSLEQPLFVGLIAIFVAGWVVFNLFGTRFGLKVFDRPPFPWLQVLVSIASFIAMTLVLIKQNLKAQQDRRRDHLQLQLIMLIEQKVAKLIGLNEELRRDLPAIDKRHDPEAEVLRKATHPQTVIDAIEGTFDGTKEK
jgi:uncharacterized membrane protein